MIDTNQNPQVQPGTYNLYGASGNINRKVTGFCFYSNDKNSKLRARSFVPLQADNTSRFSQWAGVDQAYYYGNSPRNCPFVMK